MNQNGGKAGTVTSEQKAMLDQDTMSANFKYLHVGGGTGAATKSKWFQLSLEITNPNPSLGQSPVVSNSGSHEADLPPSQHLSVSNVASGSNQSLQSVSIATLLSPPITIISKPSKKTARTRNIASSILDLAHVSLFNRINSQTVRTKYMSVDKEKGAVSASGVGWSAFVIRVVRGPGVSQGGNEAMETASSVGASPVATRSSPGATMSPVISTAPQHTSASPSSPTASAPAPTSSPTPAPAQVHPQPVHYGSVITLTDPSTNISSDPLIIRKVDKGKVSFDDVGPISQMQKVCLQRWDGGPTTVVPGTPRVYLSAANLMYPSNGGAGTSQDAESSPSASNPGGEPKSGAPHALSYQPPRTTTENRGDTTVEVDEVDDFLCWTLVGVSKFQYTFFDGNILTRGQLPSSPSNTTSELTTMTSLASSPLLPYISNLPSRSITPFPTIISAPVFRPATQSLELTISNFFTPTAGNGNGQPQMVPLEIWLADIGPLRYVYPPGSTPGGMSGSGVMGNKGVPILPAGMTMGMPSYNPNTVSTNATIVVEMPSMPEILYTAGIIDRAPGSAGSADGKMEVSQNLSSTPPPSIFVTNTGDPAAPRSLPLLFVRPTDRVGYHSGRSVLCENVFAGMNGNENTPQGGNPPGVGMLANTSGPSDEWMKAAQAAAASVADGALHGWTLRIV
jgi:recombining binding protein (suppressor of hairless)